MTTAPKSGERDAAAAPEKAPPIKFSGYQKFVVALLAFLQFSIVLDFMIISPLGAVIMPDLDISPQRFGEIVSAYAFSAGASGFLAAGFADRFDRKRFLLFFYCGFIGGTALCALAHRAPVISAAATPPMAGFAARLYSLSIRFAFPPTQTSAHVASGLPCSISS